MYAILITLHVLFAMGFFLAHGTEASVIFKIRNERNPEAICTLLELSRSVQAANIITFMGMLLTGVIGGFWLNWWRMGWIWAALILLTVIYISMGTFGRRYFMNVSRAVGMPVPGDEKKGIQPRPASREELETVVASGHPRLLASIGLSGLTAIVFLMMLKPF